MNLCLYWAINDPKGAGQRILWGSPSYSQSDKIMKELHAAIVDSGIVESVNFSSNIMKLKTGATLCFRSTERYDLIRGETFTAAVLDEFAFMKEEAWRTAIRPTLIVKGKKIVFISSPRGKNEFYNLYQQGLNPDTPNYKAYKSTIYETPFIAQEEIEDAKKTLPEAIFKQEYLAEFLDSGGEVFSNLDGIVSHTWPRQQGKIYCGFDVARAEDFSVAVFMDSSGNVIDIYRANGMDWSTIVDEVVAKIKKYSATTLIETNGSGDPIFEMVKKQWQDTHPFVTTAKSKNEIIEGLILDVNERNITIPSKELFPPLVFEMETFTFDYNPKTRSIRYGHVPGGHDDTVLALAFANYNRKVNKTIGTYSYMTRR